MRTARATSSRVAELEHQIRVLTAKLDAAQKASTAVSQDTSIASSILADEKSERALFLSQSGGTVAHPASRQFVVDAWSEEDDIGDEKEASVSDTEKAPLLGTHRLPSVTMLGPTKTRRILQLYADQTQPSKSVFYILLSILSTGRVRPFLSVYPILSWSKFLEDYEANEPLLPYVADRIWLATLQVVIAHAIQTLSPEIDVSASPSTFFIESLHILGLPVLLGTNSPALVQCLLLLTAFAQTLNEPDLIMSLLGLSIQKCRALGFTSRGLPDGHTRLARLCWSGCISRDL